ncbi:MAG: phage tail sheath C-terminal domain-containing protein [Candidatus Poseidoniales archaeon]
MALFTPSESPAVVVKEIDTTGGVPNVQTSTGAIVGNFRWGPVEQRTLVANEQGLVDTFATPNTTNAIDFHNASYFLRYSNSLQVVRMTDSSGANASSTTGQTSSYNKGALTNPVVKNKSNFDAQQSSLDSDGYTFIARFPGALGNSLRVSVCPPSISDSAFDAWAYKASFDGAPGTSTYASNRDGTNDEVHIAVVDLNGTFTGTAGTVLEAYPYVSVATDAKGDFGQTNYAINVVNERSSYVHMIGFDSDFTNSGNAGTATTAGSAKTFLGSNNDAIVNFAFDSGVDTSSLNTAKFASGFDLFEDKEAVEIDFLIAPGMSTRTDHATVVNDLVSIAGTTRKDCVVTASPARSDVVNLTNEATITTNLTTTLGQFTNSSHLIVDGNYLKVYDKYNDQYIQIPASSSTAGLMAETDRVAAPWFSPAGARRGNYLGVTSIDYNPNKTNRDTLYKAGINPIVNVAGSGVQLFGDKTRFNRPSAFDRINVRRLFLVLERAISRAAQNVLFEFNDEFTRAEFVNVIEPVLRDVKGRRGITDYRIVADETVNTQAVIDRNEFIANIFVKPARSINYVTLNFVAVRTGVDFEEVVGSSGV